MPQGSQRISANRHRPGDQDFSENGISLFTARETEALDRERLPKGPTDLGLELTLGISPSLAFLWCWGGFGERQELGILGI